MTTPSAAAAAIAGAALALALAAAPAPASAQAVRIATEGAYAPWNFIDEAGDLAGFEIDLADELCSRMGRECEIVANEWDSIIPNLRAGNYDVIMAGMSITDERRESIDFTQEYFPPDPSRWAAAPGFAGDLERPRDLRLGAQVGTIQAGYIQEQFGSGNTILTYESPDQSVADLAAGNIDALFADGSFLTPVVEGSGGDLEFVGPEVSIGGGVGAGLRKADDDLEDALNGALDSVKADGTLDALIAEWFERGPFYTQ